MDIMKETGVIYLRLAKKIIAELKTEAEELGLTTTAYVRYIINLRNASNSQVALRERERKEKEAKRIEIEREQILTATATKRACARDDDFFDLVHNFAVKKGYTVEEEEAWKAFAESNDWHYKKGNEEITRENFRNSLVKFVQRRRDEAKKRQEREEAERRMNPDKPDKWGFTEFEYMFEATMNDLSIDEAKKRMRAKRRA